MKALASQGLLGLIIPKEFGGLGQNHVCSVMVVETIARYGCPSTAMVFIMHCTALSALLMRHHTSARIQDLLRRVNEETLIGTVSYSDPATGGHFWYPLSSRTQMTVDGKIKLLKYGSWATSAGFADFYVIMTISPKFDGDFSNLSCFLLSKDEVRANTADWSSLGMHGNQSGPLVCDSTVTEDQLIGQYGEGRKSIDEVGTSRFTLMTSSCWNGIAMGAVDIARRHVTTKEHADIGMRIGDYPSIQDYFGEVVSGTNACRVMAFTIAQRMDDVTNNNDWNVYKDWDAPLRIASIHPCWCWQLRFECAKNVNKATDKMMQACGGAGYKRDLGLERLLRDGRAGWLMGPSNEVLRQFIGKTALFGVGSLDLWSHSTDRRTLNAELLKLDDDQKMEVAQRLMREVALNEPMVGGDKDKYQDTEFENPFNTRPPATRGPFTGKDGVQHLPALSPENFVSLELLSVTPIGDKQAQFQFALPQASQHTGCLSGQYLQARVPLGNGSDQFCQRYFSPVSSTNTFGRVDLVMKFESHGEMSRRFQALSPGDLVEFRGPCGGFEYTPNSTKHLSLLASGSGATPCIQLMRDIVADPSDQTSISMLYYADDKCDLMFKDELDDYAAHDGRFRVFYTVSKGAEEESWKGGEGHIDKTMISDHLPRPQTEEHKILLCGGPAMIVSVMHILFQMGFSSERIFVYGQFGAEQVRAVYGKNAKLSSHRAKS